MSEKYSMELIQLSDDDSVDTFEVSELGEGNYLLTTVDEHGSVYLHHYPVPSELFTAREESKIPVGELSLEQCNQIMREQRLLSTVKYSDPKRQLTFKEHKDITSQ